MYSLHKQMFHMYYVPGSRNKKKTKTKSLPLIENLIVYSAKKSWSRILGRVGEGNEHLRLGFELAIALFPAWSMRPLKKPTVEEENEKVTEGTIKMLQRAVMEGCMIRCVAIWHQLPFHFHSPFVEWYSY